MARKGRMKNYKLVNAQTQAMGSAGGQIRVGVVDKLDAQGMTAWLNNIMVTVLVDEAEQDNIGFIVYATTGSSWNDDWIIAARGGAVGGTVNLPVKRAIRDESTDTSRNDGAVHLWLEFGDTIASESARIVTETWGRFIEFTEV